MAERRAVGIVNGKVRPLPSGDKIPLASIPSFGKIPVGLAAGGNLKLSLGTDWTLSVLKADGLTTLAVQTEL